MKKTEIYISKSRPRIFEFFFCFFDETGKNLLCPILREKCKIDFIYSKSSIKPSTHLSSPFPGRKVNKPPLSLLSLPPPSPPLYSQMIDCILINHDCNTSRAARFIHVLEVRICLLIFACMTFMRLSFFTLRSKFYGELIPASSLT